ncbi:MAG TPA: methyltransferase domain-containing protein [Nocardioidaceae bacterium]|nr:methyltransferase domain-containing protein [Nocardioidaceae bacterium]
MTELIDDAAADRALKTKHRALWASGDYNAVASEVIPHLGTRLVAATGIGAGQRVLDIAAGSGNAAIPAALTGATVVASDLTPELFDAGRHVAKLRGAELEWDEADAENLPYADGAFDATISVVGIMFAPHHQAAADEMLRVTRSGGTVAHISWTPAGFIGQLFATLKPYAPPPPPGASPAPLWGDADHVNALFGDRVTDVRAEAQQLQITRFATAAEFRDFFKAFYGPTIAVYKNIADDPDKVAELDEALVALGERFGIGAGPVSEWEYLLYTAVKV